jgi:hypothetical protein
MTQQQLPSDDDSPVEPTMELLGGDATAARTAGPSLFLKLARGTLFGVVLLTASALLAVSAVPQLGRYLTLGGDASGASCAAGGAACTTLDKVNFDAPCCATQSVAASTEASGCCLDATAVDADGLLASEGAAGSCCATLSRAALLKASADAPACCSESSVAACASSGGTCPAAQQIAAGDEPIDASSLLATSQPPADEENGEEQAELAPDDNSVED